MPSSADKPNPSFAADTDISNEKIVSWFQSEAARFVEVVNTPGLSGALSHYVRSPDSGNKTPSPKLRPPKALKSLRIIDANVRSDWLWEVLASAQVAVCCDLFRNCSVSLRDVSQHDMLILAADVVQQSLDTNNDDDRNRLKAKLQVVDTVRIMQMLRGLGLFRRPAHSTQQLCLGAGLGVRDIDAMHANLWLDEGRATNMHGTSSRSKREVTFRADFPGVKRAIFVDMAPALSDIYEEINLKSDGQIIALNQDLDEGFFWIKNAIKSGAVDPCNVVAGYRIDHRMIPDVCQFFTKLSSVISETADFIVSIGAGNNVEEFQGRIDKILEVEQYLKNQELSPVRIRLCKGNNAEELRNSPLFGFLEIASYEVLYCKLKRKKLMKC